jgi:hypothetical protein
MKFVAFYKEHEMSRGYLYDTELSHEQNLQNLIVNEIEATCAQKLMDQQNPFIYLMAVKHLIAIHKLGLRINSMNGTTAQLTNYFAFRELDVLLASNPEFNSRRQSAHDFTKYLLKELLPSAKIVLYLLRED